MTDALATRYEIALPPWAVTEAAGLPAVLPTAEDRMRVVHALAGRNFREGNGGPFAALVADADTGELVSIGVNVVLASNVSSAHAEVVALGLAQARLGTWDLSAGGRRLELVVNWRPCVQCYGAAFWSGIRSLVIAGSGPELEEVTGFDEGPVRDDWVEQFERRGITVTDGVLRDEALATWDAYRAHVQATGAVVYNARQG